VKEFVRGISVSAESRSGCGERDLPNDFDKSYRSSVWANGVAGSCTIEAVIGSRAGRYAEMGAKEVQGWLKRKD
jgi:hypothetical protein